MRQKVRDPIRGRGKPRAGLLQIDMELALHVGVAQLMSVEMVATLRGLSTRARCCNLAENKFLFCAHILWQRAT